MMMQVSLWVRMLSSGEPYHTTCEFPFGSTHIMRATYPDGHCSYWGATNPHAEARKGYAEGATEVRAFPIESALEGPAAWEDDAVLIARESKVESMQDRALREFIALTSPRPEPRMWCNTCKGSLFDGGCMNPECADCAPFAWDAPIIL